MEDAEELEKLRVTAAIRTALESLLAAQIEGDLLERRMLLAASFAGALTQGLPEYSVESVVTDAGELRVTGRREGAGEDAEELYLLAITIALPDHLKALVSPEA